MRTLRHNDDEIVVYDFSEAEKLIFSLAERYFKHKVCIAFLFGALFAFGLSWEVYFLNLLDEKFYHQLRIRGTLMSRMR